MEWWNEVLQRLSHGQGSIFQGIQPIKYWQFELLLAYTTSYDRSIAGGGTLQLGCALVGRASRPSGRMLHLSSPFFLWDLQCAVSVQLPGSGQAEILAKPWGQWAAAIGRQRVHQSAHQWFDTDTQLQENAPTQHNPILLLLVELASSESITVQWCPVTHFPFIVVNCSP